MIDAETVANEPSIEEQKAMSDPKPAVLEVAGVKINYGIPIPETGSGRKKGSRWDPILEAMQPGASIFFPASETMDREVGSFQRVAKKRDVPLTTRKLESDPEFGVAGTRIWRRAE
jgi:hypothetical protein